MSLITIYLKSKIEEAKSRGVKQVIVVANMMTTMFGSVDDANIYIKALEEAGMSFKIHVDAAFGGFLFPFSSPNTSLNFSNPYIDSITLDAHKMLQAPYGAGIFLIRKGLIKYTRCAAASYVQGLDSTLCGSRSGANAIAVWMILMHYEPEGWAKKVQQLLSRTNYLCQALDELGVSYFRQNSSNIISIPSNQLPNHLVKKYLLVPDNHSDEALWFKIVVMDHVDQQSIDFFLEELSLCLVG